MDLMDACPNCESALEVERKELVRGVFAHVAVCPTCHEDLDRPAEHHEASAPIFERRAFRTGGSLAVRIPKEIADALGVRDGTRMVVRPNGNGLLLELTARRALGGDRPAQ